MEKRNFECRFEDDGTLRGMAVPYLQKTQIGNFQEQFLPGAFGRPGEVRLNFQHNRDRPLAVNKDGGGLRLLDGESGMRAEIDLPDTSDGRDARTLIKRGVLSGFSVEFRALDEEWDDNTRTIRKAELDGIALVDRPQYENAIVEMRQAKDAWYSRKGKVDLWPFL